MRTIFFFAILYLLFQSCSSNQVNLEGETQRLVVPSSPAGSSYFIKHFELTEMVPIQTCDTCLIADIKKLIRYQEKIILLSGQNNTVYLINAQDGSIEYRIHQIGRGPGESMTIVDVGFDEVSKQILVYNDYSKLLFFDFQGQFVSEIKLDEQYESISCHDGEVIFHNRLEGYSCYPYLFNVLNLTDKTYKKVGDSKRVDFPIRSVGKQMVLSKKLWFSAPLDFNLYHFSNDDQLQIPYGLSITQSHLDESLARKSVSNPAEFFKAVLKNNLIYSINSIRETDKYLVFRSNQRGIFIVDKEKNEVFWDETIEEESLQMKLHHYFPHEGDDDKIMFVLSPDDYLSNLRANNENPPKIKEDDNPILLFYKQKDI